MITTQRTQLLYLDFSSFIYWIKQASAEYLEESTELDRLIDAFFLSLENPQQWEFELAGYLSYLEECARLYDLPVRIDEIKRIMLTAGNDFIRWAVPAGLYPEGRLVFQYSGRLGNQAVILTRF